jgi:hypothetical protein
MGDPTRDDPEQVREAAEELGIEDTEGKDADELTQEAAEAQADSAVSPSAWHKRRDHDDA